MMGNGVSNRSWSCQFQQLQRNHDAAYCTIEEAIKLEEQERPNDAVEKYKDGILAIDQALDIVITCPENPDSTWQQACSMVQKMKKTRAEVLQRINSITSAPNYVFVEPPPSYEDAMSSSSESSVPRTYNELASALENLDVNETQGPAEIIYTHDGVRLYFISPDGMVLSTSEPTILNVVLVDGDEGVPPTAFLQVGNWIYPLVPGVSPCFRTDYGAFILPDVHSSISGSSVGIILPDDADHDVLELLENILHGVVTQQPKKLEERLERPRRYVREPGVSGSISRGIITGAYYLSKGLIFGAQKAGDLINYGTPKLINKMAPAQEERPVPRNVSKGLKIAETTSSKAAEFSGIVADKVGIATAKLGKFLAPHIQKQGTRLLTSGFKISEEEASNKVSGVLTVAAGAVEGFATVYKGLETSASILGHNLKENSVKIVEHKYGAPAGEAANETLNTVGNVISIRNNTRFFTPKGLAKKTATNTGKALVQEYKDVILSTDSNQPGTSTSTNLYPSIDGEIKHIVSDDNSLLPKKE